MNEFELGNYSADADVLAFLNAHSGGSSAGGADSKDSVDESKDE